MVHEAGDRDGGTMTTTTSMHPTTAPAASEPSSPGVGRGYLRFWRRMPRELGYLAVTAIIGVVSIVVFNTLQSLGAGLLAVLVGVLVFALLLIATSYLGIFELYRLRLARLPAIPAPTWQRPFRTGKGFFRALGDLFANPHSWLYYVHSGLLSPILAVLTTAIWLPWLAVSIALTLTPTWAFVHPFATHVGAVYVAGRDPRAASTGGAGARSRRTRSSVRRTASPG